MGFALGVAVRDLGWRLDVIFAFIESPSWVLIARLPERIPLARRASRQNSKRTLNSKQLPRSTNVLGNDHVRAAEIVVANRSPNMNTLEPSSYSRTWRNLCDVTGHKIRFRASCLGFRL